MTTAAEKATTIFRRPRAETGFWSWITTVDHKRIGRIEVDERESRGEAAFMLRSAEQLVKRRDDVDRERLATAERLENLGTQGINVGTDQEFAEQNLLCCRGATLKQCIQGCTANADL